jgi:hypothetical protein
MIGPAHTVRGNHNSGGGPAHSPDDGQRWNGGPAQPCYDSQVVDGGPALWSPALLADLRAADENLADVIELRKAARNRARTLSMLDASPEALDWIATAEQAAREALLDSYERAVPLHIRQWAAEIPGLRTGARLPRIIAEIGDPCLAVPLLPIAKGDTGRGARSRPAGPAYVRSPHQLWQYAGCGDPWWSVREEDLGHAPTQADRLRAGKRNKIRPLLYDWTVRLQTMAAPGAKGRPQSATAADSQWWKLFTERLRVTRGHDGDCTADESCYVTHRRHERQCQNHARPPARSNGCGTVLYPEWGEPGSPWRKGHVQMDAHRYVAKRLLLELWRADFAVRDLGSHPETRARRERRRRAG